MKGNHEIERLRDVYRRYRGQPHVVARHDGQNPGNQAIFAERQRLVEQLLRRHALLPLSGRRVLEVGCGSGGVLAGLLGLGARPRDLHGVDVLPERIAAAREHYPGLAFYEMDAAALALPASHFDLVLAFTVLSSILDASVAREVAAEIGRVLRPGGAVLWYDFRYSNPGNPHVRGITRRRIAALFPGFALDLRPITVLPPLARRLGPLTPLLYPALARLPTLRSHTIGLLVKPL